MIKLEFAGRCVGFAVSYRSAGHQADRLNQVLSDLQQHGRILPLDATADVSFSSAAPEISVSRLRDVVRGSWVVEVDDGTPVRACPSKEVAEWFRGTVEAYHLLLPPCGESGEWTVEQIEWFLNHPAPIASACGGRLHIRQVEVH